MSELLHGRFRVVEMDHWRPTLAVDVETGARVLLPEDSPRVPFAWKAKLRGAARALAERGDPRFAPAMSLVPLVLACPESWNDQRVPTFAPTLQLTVAEAVDVGLEMVELAAIAGEAGARASDWDVVLARDASGRIRLSVVAPLWVEEDRPDARNALCGLNLIGRLIGAADATTGLQYERVTTETPPKALRDAVFHSVPQYDWSGGERATLFPRSIRKALETLSTFGGDASRVDVVLAAIERLDRAPRHPKLDLDDAIAMGEAEGIANADDVWSHRKTRFDLAAILHHRGCLTESASDVERAIALDPHPEYLTTLALWRERDGRIDEARTLHDRAVAALAEVAPPAAGQPRSGSRDEDFRSSFPRRAARSLEARGAFRASHGDRDGALADLRASLSMHPSPSVERRLAKLDA